MAKNNSYNVSVGFAGKDRARLRDFVLDLTKNGAVVMILNSNASFVLESCVGKRPNV